MAGTTSTVPTRPRWPVSRPQNILVSNREFLEFVEAGGYRDRQWWNEEGWNWREFKQAEQPLFWIRDGDGWKLRTMASEIPLPWNWPVEVN